MRVGVDGRHLTSGRGVARYVRWLLRALAERFPCDEWLAFVPGRAPVAPVHERVTVIRHPLPGRALFAAAALTGRPALDALLGGVDVLWAPAPAPLAVTRGVPLVLTVHDLSWERRPHDFTAYERAWHRLARPRALAARARTVVTHAAAVRDDVLARAFAAARGRGLDAELVVVGDGRLAGALDGPAIRRLGTVSDHDLDALYDGALAVVQPSWLEGFGMPPLEAAAPRAPPGGRRGGRPPAGP